jgi:hypothetical protein
MMKKVLIVITALIIILLVPFIIKGFSYLSKDLDLSDSSYDEYFDEGYDENSIDGTYYWSNGVSSHTVEIYGDSWYGVTTFGSGYGEDSETESGSVRGNTLYYSGMEIGVVTGKSLRWGNSHTLRKQ